jgi:SNF2 family DNA or RNA helicase
MQANVLKLRPIFARENKLPAMFVGIILRETAKAAYVYGHASEETAKTSSCMCCGRKLTHPVSVQLGIGPECGGHWHDWSLIGGYSLANIDALKGALREIKVDCWVPKAHLSTLSESTEDIPWPSDHPILQARPEKVQAQRMVSFYGDHRAFLKITFPFSPEDLANVKTLSDRKYMNDGGHYWICPVYPINIELLQKWGFSFAEGVLPQEAPAKAAPKQDAPVTRQESAPGKPAAPKYELRPFQKEGVLRLHDMGGRGLLGDQMGLGKTCQALTWLHETPDAVPAVVVCPASLKFNWELECAMWAPGKSVQILSGKNFKALGKADITIINYDILPNKYQRYTRQDGKKAFKEILGTGWVDVLAQIQPKTLILDEAHFIKSNQAARTKGARKLAKLTKYKIAISGTPITSRPIELFNALMMVAPDRCPGFMEYTMRYCGAKHNGFGWDYTGATNTEELHERLQSCMIRRLKKDVMSELPEKIKSIIPMELSNATVYKKAEKNFAAYVLQHFGQRKADKAAAAEALVKMSYLKQLCLQGKIEQAIAWAADMLEGQEKLILFAIHKKTVDALFEGLQKFNPVKLVGDMSATQKQASVQAFQSDPDCRVFIGNIQAAGVGLTLTEAHLVAFVELPWTPGELDQAEDRAHRIGQTKGVQVFYLLARDSIEMQISEMLDDKRKVLDAILDGTKTGEENLFNKLFEHFSKVA